MCEKRPGLFLKWTANPRSSSRTFIDRIRWVTVPTGSSSYITPRIGIICSRNPSCARPSETCTTSVNRQTTPTAAHRLPGPERRLCCWRPPIAFSTSLTSLLTALSVPDTPDLKGANHRLSLRGMSGPPLLSIARYFSVSFLQHTLYSHSLARCLQAIPFALTETLALRGPKQHRLTSGLGGRAGAHIVNLRHETRRMSEPPPSGLRF